ncbi:hypothetical protein JNW90_29295 [Micromonospora sp. STR1s_5]|nr:hypothetical protein [Micromonospora sp. STR1s_5]
MSAFDTAEIIANLAATDSDTAARELLVDLSVGNLQALCSKVGLTYRSRDRKPALVSALASWASTQDAQVAAHNERTPAEQEADADAEQVTEDEEHDETACPECGAGADEPHGDGPNGPCSLDADPVTVDLALVAEATAECAAAAQPAEVPVGNAPAEQPAVVRVPVPNSRIVRLVPVEDAPAEQDAAEGWRGPEVGAYLLIAAGVATTKSVLFLADEVTSTDKGVEVKGRQFLIKHRELSRAVKTVTLASADDAKVVLPAGTVLDDAAKEALVVAARPERFGPGGKEARKGKRHVLTIDADALTAAAEETGAGVELTDSLVDALRAKVQTLLPELLIELVQELDERG